jgi:tight adherence protein B
MIRRVLVAALAAGVGAGTCAAPAFAAGLGLSEARSPAFPQRSYVLTVPEAQILSETKLSVTENGEPVEDLKVAGIGSQSAVVLVIDASRSMGGKIDDAMAAARAFAERRMPDQRLGVVFFSREPVTALEPTADDAAIDRALAEAPTLPTGTRVYDAAAAGVAMVERAHVAAGSVIVLSDGADNNSAVSRSALVEDAESAHVRMFGVGVRSRAFDSVSLESLSVNGGSYVEAARPDQLDDIYSKLADRQGREFLVSYSSRQPLESDVAVAFAVEGVPDVVTDAYRTPDFPVPPAIPDPPPSWWASDAATITAVAIIGLLVALALALLLRPLRGTLSTRIARFTSGTPTTSSEEDTTRRVRELLAAADGRLSRWKPWQDFELDVELAKVPWRAQRIAVSACAGAVVLAIVLVLAGLVAVAIAALVALPLATWALIRYRATRTRRRFEDQLPDNLQVMASALRAGHSFIAALAVMVKDAPEPSRKEFNRVVQDEQLGVPIEESLDVVNRRMRCDDVMYVGLIATLQRDTGGNTAEVLDRVVETMRERGKLRRLVRTLTAQGRLGGWIVTALPLAMLLFLVLIKPHYLDPLLERTIGWVVLIFAGMMVAFGAYCIRRIVDIKV